MVDLNTLTQQNSPVYLEVGGDINDEGVIVGQGCLPADCAAGTSFVSYVAIPTGDGMYRVSVTGSSSVLTAFRPEGAPLAPQQSVQRLAFGKLSRTPRE